MPQDDVETVIEETPSNDRFYIKIIAVFLVLIVVLCAILYFIKREHGIKTSKHKMKVSELREQISDLQHDINIRDKKINELNKITNELSMKQQQTQQHYTTNDGYDVEDVIDDGNHRRSSPRDKADKIKREVNKPRPTTQDMIDKQKTEDNTPTEVYLSELNVENKEQQMGTGEKINEEKITKEKITKEKIIEEDVQLVDDEL